MSRTTRLEAKDSRHRGANCTYICRQSGGFCNIGDPRVPGAHIASGSRHSPKEARRRLGWRTVVKNVPLQNPRRVRSGIYISNGAQDAMSWTESNDILLSQPLRGQPCCRLAFLDVPVPCANQLEDIGCATETCLPALDAPAGAASFCKGSVQVGCTSRGMSKQHPFK